MKKIKSIKGFSLVEMLIAMLVVAVVLAASSPMITKKVQRQKDGSVFEVLPSDPDNAVEFIKGKYQRIFMKAKDSDGYVGIVDTNQTIGKNSVVVGSGSINNKPKAVGIGIKTDIQEGAVTLGYDTLARGYAVAIGNQAQALNGYTTVVGTEAVASASAYKGCAIGYSAKADGGSSVAIGAGAKATKDNSVAIGAGAETDQAHTVVLGTAADTVYIPGNLVVEHAALIGRAAGELDNLYFRPGASREDGRQFGVISNDDWKGGDDAYFDMIINSYNGEPRVKVGPYTSTKVTHDDDDDLDDNNKLKINFGYISPSDRRLKNVSKTFTGGLEELEKLHFYHFTFKDDEKETPQVGVMAQDLQTVFPDAVKEDAEGWLLIRWDEMFYSAINAIVEIGAKVRAIATDVANLQVVTEEHRVLIESQAKLIEQQQAEIADLQERVKKLERRRKK